VLLVVVIATSQHDMLAAVIAQTGNENALLDQKAGIDDYFGEARLCGRARNRGPNGKN